MRTGDSASSTSTGAFARLAAKQAQPSMPSLPGRPPQVPVTESHTMKVLPSGLRPPMRQLDTPPSPVAGMRSGAACASAPIAASITRKPVTPRDDTAAGSTGLVMVPSGTCTWIGRNTPALFGRSGGSIVRTAA